MENAFIKKISSPSMKCILKIKCHQKYSLDECKNSPNLLDNETKSIYNNLIDVILERSASVKQGRRTMTVDEFYKEPSSINEKSQKNQINKSPCLNKQTLFSKLSINETNFRILRSKFKQKQMILPKEYRMIRRCSNIIKMPKTDLNSENPQNDEIKLQKSSNSKYL